MVARMEFDELCGGNVGVDGRGVKPGVAEDALDAAQWCAAVVHVGGRRVAQKMAAAGDRNAGAVEVAAHELAKGANRPIRSNAPVWWCSSQARNRSKGHR